MRVYVEYSRLCDECSKCCCVMRYEFIFFKHIYKLKLLYTSHNLYHLLNSRNGADIKSLSEVPFFLNYYVD